MKIRVARSGLQLFDRLSGLNVLIDETSPPSDKWSLAPRYCSIALTTACDLTCPHCSAPNQHASLDQERVVRWALELDRHGCLGIGFGGGEPTLFPKFANLCQRIAGESDLAVSFTTHGHLLTSTLGH